MESVQWMAQRINSLLEYMRYGYALIAYRKQDGSFYMGRGTLVSYESDFKKKHDMTSIKAHVAYWDAEQQGWRTFLIENFYGVETDSKLTKNTNIKSYGGLFTT